LATRLNDTRELLAVGLPPDPQLDAELAATRDTFWRRYADARSLAETLAVALPPIADAYAPTNLTDMARNVGTAFAITTLGVIFNQQLATALPAQLGDLLAAGVSKITVAATNFSATGAGQAHEIAAAILHDFATLGVITAIFGALSTVAVLYLKPRPAPQETDPVAAPRREASFVAATEH